MRYINEYSFLELRAAVDADRNNAEAIADLVKWCERFGDCWNGERWDVSIPGKEPSGSVTIKPVYRFEAEEVTPEELNRLEKEDPDKYETMLETVGYELC